MTKAREAGAKVRVPPPAVFLGMIVIGLVIQLAVRAWPTSLALDQRLTAGVVMLILGVALGGSAIGLFRKTGQDPAPWKPSPTMVETGPYRFTRNPMYLAMVVVTCAIGILANTSWIVLGAPLGLAIVHFIAVRPEETYLAAKFGADYEAYRARVPRYL